MSESPAASPPLEVELKYRLADRGAGDRYLDATEMAGFVPVTPVRSGQVEDRYLDTSDGALAQAGFAARLRRTGRDTTVTVKSTARRIAGTNVHRREELEGPADRTADPRDWPPSDARSLILELCGDAPLAELVTIRQLRRKRDLRSGETVVELSIDEVDVVAGSRVVDGFVELEVELVEGDEAALAALDALLATDPQLSAAGSSKLEAALTAVRDTAGRRRRAAERRARPAARPGPRTAPAAATATTAPVAARAGGATAEPPRLVAGRSPCVLADDHVAEAGRKVLRFHLARMLAAEAGARDGGDPEAVHRMRVATRRQRAAWRVFGDAFRAGRTKAHRRRLREVAARLGAVRDLDVQLEAADAHGPELSAADRRGLEPLLSGWRAARDDARALLLRTLDSDGYRRWLDDYVEFVRHEGLAVVPVVATRPHRVRDTAGSRILAAYENVRAYEPVLRRADVGTLHELRIAGKWLRYTMEFVREPLGPEVDPLIARVTAMQDHLGMLQDADVTARLARSFLVENAGSLDPAERGAIGRYLAGREEEIDRLRRTVGRPWRGVAGVAFRRALGRTVAGL